MSQTPVNLEPVEDPIPWLRKAVEWVEYQEQLPEIDREWEQAAYIEDPRTRALNMAAETVEYTSREHWRDVAEQIEPHCGTAYCVAGYLGQLMDERYIYDDYIEGSEEGDGLHVGYFVQLKLGLTPMQARQLFDGGNTAEDVRRIAEKIAGQRL